MCFCSSAQKLDSLERSWNEITDDSLRVAQQIRYAWELYDNYRYDQGQQLAERILTNFPESLRDSLLHLRSLYQNTLFASAVGQMSDFQQLWQDAYSIAMARQDTAYLIELTNLRAGQYMNELRYDSAYQTYQHSMDLAIASNDLRSQNTLLNNQAIIFGEQGLVEKAKNNFWKATEGALAVGDTVLAFLGYNNVGYCYIELEKPDSARIYLDASQAFMTSPRQTMERGLLHYNYGLVAKVEKNYTQAVEDFHRALFYSQDGADALSTCRTFAKMGEVQFALSQYDSASYYLIRAERLAQQLEANEVLRDVLPMHAKSYAAQRNWEKAYEYADRSLALRDKYLTEEVQRQVAEMEAKYQLSNYEKENELLRTIGEEREQQLKERTFFGILGFISFIMIAGLAGLAWRRNQTIRALNTDLEQKVTARTAELENANTQLQEYLEDLKVFTHITSHDLKEPLRNISGFSTLLRRRLGPELNEETTEFMDMIRVNANQMHELIEGIQFYALLDPQAEMPELEEVDLQNVCGVVKSSLNTFISEKGGKCSMPDEKLPVVQASPQAIQVILKNLVENAMKYNDKEVPEVGLSYTKTAAHHLLSVRDNGIGVKPEYHEQIFQMFKRLHTRQDYAGTGMGLAISRKLARRFGGDITVESTPGKGSIFTLHWPVS